MCLGIPMKIKSIRGEFADVASAGLTRTVNIQMLKTVKVGDYVIVHAGFAIERIDQKKAEETLRMISELP